MYMLTTIQDKDHYNSLKYHHCYTLNVHLCDRSVVSWPLCGRDVPGGIRGFKIKNEKSTSLTNPALLRFWNTVLFQSTCQLGEHLEHLEHLEN